MLKSCETYSASSINEELLGAISAAVAACTPLYSACVVTASPNLKEPVCFPQTFSSVQDVLVSFGRRVLCYPLYRHFEMVSAAVDDATKILQSGESHRKPHPPPRVHMMHTHRAESASLYLRVSRMDSSQAGGSLRRG